MKTLLVLRHAKAQKDAPNGDWARNLTDRGRSDAEATGSVIRRLLGAPDAIISSDAHRAMQTAQIAGQAAGFSGEIAGTHDIYEANSNDLVNIIRTFPADDHSVMIVGHNPAFEDLVRLLATQLPDDFRMPTAGLAVLSVPANTWSQIHHSSCELVAFEFPKKTAD